MVLIIIEESTFGLGAVHVAPKLQGRVLDVSEEISSIGPMGGACGWSMGGARHQALRSLPRTCLRMALGVTPKTLTTANLARWLGNKVGLPPTGLGKLIKPYAPMCPRTVLTGPKQGTQYQAQLKRASQTLTNTTLRSQLSWERPTWGLLPAYRRHPPWVPPSFPTLPQWGTNPMACPASQSHARNLDVDDPSSPETQSQVMTSNLVDHEDWIAPPHSM